MIKANVTTNEISSSDRTNQFIARVSKVIIFFEDLCAKSRQKKVFFIAPSLIVFGVFIIATFSSPRVVYSFTQNRKPRYLVAHCMTGNPRTLYKEEVYMAYRRQALDKLPGDLFVVLQLPKRTEMVHGTVITSSPPERYSTALKFLSPRKIEWIPENHRIPAIEGRSGYAKWQRCLEHIQEVEKKNGIRYDYIVRSRPDLFFAKDLPTPNLLPNDRILINPYYECLQDVPSGYNQTWSDHQAPCDNKNYGISDLFAIIPRKLADPYMRVAYTPNLPLHVCGARASHPECAIRAALYKANITFELWPFTVKIMRPAEFCHRNSWNHFNSWC